MTDTAGIGLKPCPFCGGEAALKDYTEVDDIQWAFVECSRCYVALEGDSSAQSAIAAWNTRASDATLSSQAAEIERLREALGKAEWALVEAAIPLEAILAAGKGSLSMAVWDGVANATAHVRRYMDARAALNGEKE